MRGDGSANARARFRSQDVFRCPELDVRMKKYLVRLANETANHLIRDTLEPNMPGVRRPRARSGGHHASNRGGAEGNANDDANDEDEDEDEDEPEGEADGQVDARAAATNGLVWKKLSVVRGIQLLRGHDVVLAKDHARDVPAAAACCLRGLSEVNASVEEFAMLFKHDSHKQFADHGLLFNPDLLDMATLYALVQPSGDHPRRYVGIKWCLVQAPSKLFRDRDFCYLECQKEFRDARGRRGWVRSMHSIKMPCCPSLEKPHGIVRASMYRCGLTAVESARPGVLDVTYTVEMDLKGHFPELFQPGFIAQRIVSLAAIDRFLQQQRLSSSPLLGDLDLPRAAALKTTCHLCYRTFSALRVRRVVCRKCGQGVCRSCSGAWELDIPVVGKTKVRICTVCSAEARFSHAAPDKRFASLRGVAAAADAGAAGPPFGRRQERSSSFNGAPSDAHHPRAQPGHRPAPEEEFQHQPFQEPAYEQFRPTYAMRDTQSDPFLDEYSTPGLANVRATTDLTGMWDPREDNQPAPIPSPASYFGAHRPPSFAEPTTPPSPPPQQHARPSHVVVAPARESILLRQPSYEDPPVDSYLDHHRRSFDHARTQRRRHTTALGPPFEQPPEFRSERAVVGFRDPTLQPHEPVGQQRRRQQSYPFSADQYPPPTRAMMDVYPQQRHRQQAEPGMHFPAVHDGSRNFALEFFNEQYRSSSKPPPRATTTMLTPQEQHFFQEQQALAHQEAAVLQPPSTQSFETRHSEREQQWPLQQHAQSQSTLQASQSSQTAGEVIEYIETPEGEWIEQRQTALRVRRDSGEREREDEELLQPGFCIYCGSKRVVHRGAIESTCTCELGGKRSVAREPRKSVAGAARVSEKAVAADVERLTEWMARQTLHANAPQMHLAKISHCTTASTRASGESKMSRSALE
ncbi:hypothetical protein PybrP1_010971 [[Pythium] brassicae (nom. inval.)]|nr:hypothetical protein PybrP1_010971 [[Pythium] brassicae (nom. inval.)]